MVNGPRHEWTWPQPECGFSWYRSRSSNTSWSTCATCSITPHSSPTACGPRTTAREVGRLVPARDDLNYAAHCTSADAPAPARRRRSMEACRSTEFAAALERSAAKVGVGPTRRPSRRTRARCISRILRWLRRASAATRRHGSTSSASIARLLYRAAAAIARRIRARAGRLALCRALRLAGARRRPAVAVPLLPRAQQPGHLASLRPRPAPRRRGPQPAPARSAARRGWPLRAGGWTSGPDGEAERQAALVRDALGAAIARLAPRDRLRLAWYYQHGMTLAQIGRLCQEHEATVSRHLTRTRKALRGDVEGQLQHARAGCPRDRRMLRGGCGGSR